MSIVLKTGGKVFSKWNKITVNLKLDTVASTFTFEGFIEETNKHLFEPIGYTECEVWIIDEEKGINERLITGYITNPGLSDPKNPHYSTISGFSRPGILQNNNIAKKLYPLQWNNMSLAQLSKKICDHYNLTLKIHEGAEDEAAKKFNEIKCKAQEPIKDFLSRYAKLRGITVSHDNEGNLFLYRIVDKTDATSEVTTDYHYFNMELRPNGQQVHTECLAIQAAEIRETAEGEGIDINTVESALVYSPFVTQKEGQDKPKLSKTILVDEGEDVNIKEYAEAELAREAKAFPITIDKEGWVFKDTDENRPSKWRVVRAGFYLMVENENILYKKNKTVIETMTFTKEADDVERLSLTCVLPCVYTGKLPPESPFVKYNVKKEN